MRYENYENYCHGAGPVSYTHLDVYKRQMLDCIECGSCAYVCPARIPLVAQFRLTKGKIQAKRMAEKAKADAEKAKAEAEKK